MTAMQRDAGAAGTSDGEREYAERPWGNYTVLDDDAPTTRSSASSSIPGKRLSYQRHAQRAEHWFIVSGTAHGDPRRRRDARCRRGRRSTSRSRAAHRIANDGDADVVFIEVQHGDLLRRGRHRPARGRLRPGRDDERGQVPRDADRRPPRGGADVLLRVLPPEERRGAGHPGPHHQRAPAPRALLRLGDLPGRRGVAPAHVRPGDRHAAHHDAQPDGAPHLRGPHPPGAGRHPGLVAQGRASRTSWRSAATPRRSRGRARRAGLRQRAGGAGPRHRRLLDRGGRPPGRAPALDRPGERPRLPGRQAGAGGLRASPSSSSRPPSTRGWWPTSGRGA